MHIKKIVVFTFLALGFAQVSKPFPTDFKFILSGKENSPFVIDLFEGSGGPITEGGNKGNIGLSFTLASEANDTQEAFNKRNKIILNLLQSRKPKIAMLKILTPHKHYHWYYKEEDTRPVTILLTPDMTQYTPDREGTHKSQNELITHGTRLQLIQAHQVRAYLIWHPKNKYLEFMQSTKAKIAAGIVALGGIGALYTYFTQKPVPIKITEPTLTNNTEYEITIKDKATDKNSLPLFSVLPGKSLDIRNLYDDETTIIISDGKNSLEIAFAKDRELNKNPHVIIRSASLYERYIQGKTPLQFSVVWHPVTLRFKSGQ